MKKLENFFGRIQRDRANQTRVEAYWRDRIFWVIGKFKLIRKDTEFIGWCGFGILDHFPLIILITLTEIKKIIVFPIYGSVPNLKILVMKGCVEPIPLEQKEFVGLRRRINTLFTFELVERKSALAAFLLLKRQRAQAVMLLLATMGSSEGFLSNLFLQTNTNYTKPGRFAPA